MNSIDDFFHQSHYNIIRVFFSIMGLWPCHTTSKRRTIYLGYFLLLGSGYTFQIMGMIEVWSNSIELIDCLPLLALSSLSTIKLICAVYTLPKIKILLIKMRNYCLSAKSNEETNILHSYALYGRNLGYVYTGVILTHLVIFLFATFLTKFFDGNDVNNSSSITPQKGLVYRVNYMVDVETYYVPIFIHTTACDAIYAFFMLVFDVFYLTLVQHCCGLFAALRYRLEYAVQLENSDGDLVSMVRQNKIRSNILYSIQRHTEAIQFVTIMESIYRMPLFLHVGANISILSILGFQVITNTEDINRTLKNAVYFSVLFMNTFFENWQGQKIIDSSEKVYESAYNVEWYKMQTDQRKFLIMMMVRSKKPFQMTAGSFVALSHVNFNAVVRASSSYFMLLRSTQ